MTLSDYSKLKQQVVLSVINTNSYTHLLQSVKEIFKNGINSVRRFEQIETIEHLLKVLELRDLLSEDDITPLKDIAKRLNNLVLLNRINVYQDTHASRKYVNYYVPEKENEPTTHTNNFEPIFATHNYDEKKELIFLTVTERIGSAWKDLARSLQIQECIIDEIDASSTTMASKAFKMLKRFDSRADRYKWHLVLCEALDKIRRKELRCKVQEIMMMNI